MDADRVRRDPTYARAAVLARDGGVCALCGCDTEALRRAYHAAKAEAHAVHAGHLGRLCAAERQGVPEGVLAQVRWRAMDALSGRIRGIESRLMALGYCPGHPLWQADHVIPVAEGGGGCGLDGLRTLCHPCHVRESTALRRRLRKAPKKARVGLIRDRRGRTSGGTTRCNRTNGSSMTWYDPASGRRLGLSIVR